MAARVLLIEDDPSIARFVQLALEELPGHDITAPAVELHVVRRVADAREALAEQRWQLVISDLMLPDGSAEGLLADGLAQAPDSPPWMVFSAGVPLDRHAALTAWGVRRILRKPVPLGELLGTVSELLGGGAPGPAAAAVPAAADPVEQHFGGDRLLYENFRSACLLRFADDLGQGDAAVSSGDAAALRRVAHGLKAVLELLGHTDLAEQARLLENAAASEASGPALADGWQLLAGGLVELRQRA